MSPPRPIRAVLAAAFALALLLGCSDPPTVASSALSTPIDFAWACEGEGQTQGPVNDERAASMGDTRMCPDVTPVTLGQTVQGNLFGVVLNRHPASLVVLQLNPASGRRTFIDADLFVPGITGIRVGRTPIRVLTAADFSAFYVLSAGDRRVDRVVIEGYTGTLNYRVESFPLPGVPSDGVTLPDRLVVTAAETPELWVYDLSGDPAAPALTVVPLPDAVHRVLAHGDELIVTWRDRPVVSRLGLDGALLHEAGLVPACRDTLDNDGDGLIDADDPDCAHPDDDDESGATGAPRPAVIPPAAPGFAGAPLCSNGIDDNGSGYTDWPDDPACLGPDDDGEGRPACSDGVDNDGDGRLDFDGGGDPTLASPSCYAPWLNRERRLPVDGPFEPALIEAGEVGTFLYVLDVRLSRIRVFEIDSAGALVRVDTHAEDIELPALRSVAYSDPAGEVREDQALRAARRPWMRRAEVRDIAVDGVAITALSATQLRGELWDRIIAADSAGEAPSVPFGAAAGLWRPTRCAPDRPEACFQPEGDDATWYLLAPRLDGRVVQIEAIRRGIPLHRVAQRRALPQDRGVDVGGPRLTLRGRFIVGRGQPQAGYPFMGAGIEELIADAVPGEAPALLRRFGIWPALDPEQVESEEWRVTYEGRIPGTRAHLGRLTADDAFFDANARFCEAGVAPGDWLQLELPALGAAPELHHEAAVVTEQGAVCPTLSPTITLVEVPITEVGMHTLGLDPAGARLRPARPELDDGALAGSGLSRRACEAALRELDDVLGRPEQLAAAPGFGAALVPERLIYSVRVGGQWSIVGTRSGFLHRQRWDREAAACVVDETLDPRLTARHDEANVDVTRYGTCPPPADLLRFEAIESLTPASARFENPSFAIDILPGCEETGPGILTRAPTQQDTMWAFTLTGPHEPATFAVTRSNLGVRVPILGLRRHAIQLDAAANRASLIQIRPGDPSVITVFE